ncbi:MAG: hypothetical protein I3274_05250 [Candidatus Moeniiplasma glomeromycotorum]|nr:hypothetical protein [Candidatus Moeniiplasma glomeromycotorum]
MVLSFIFLLIYYFPSNSDKKLNEKITKKLDEPRKWEFVWGKTTPFNTDKKILKMGAYGGKAEEIFDLEDKIKKWVEEAKKASQYIIQYVNDNYFVKFDRNSNVWKVFCYYEDKKLEVDIKADTICQLISNDERQPHLSPKILDGALSELITKIIKEIK